MNFDDENTSELRKVFFRFSSALLDDNMSKESDEIYEFGHFRLNVGEHIFERLDGEKNGSLPEKAFQTLTVLVRNHGNLVTKDDLLEAVWPDTIVEENNLDKAIHAVRHALGENSRDNKYIQTVRKHGYRFVAPVRKAADLRGVRPYGNETKRITKTFATLLDRTGSWTVQVGLILVLTGAALAVGAYLVSKAENSKDTGNREDGQTQQEVRGTESEEAYAFYRRAAVTVKGRSNKENLRESIINLENSIARDQNFAAAHALLARKRIEISNLVDDPAEHCEKARDSIAKALELDKNMSDAYLALALQNYRCDWDFDGAKRAFSRALELEPNSVDALSNYAVYLNTVGDSDAAIAAIERALQFDQSSEMNHNIHGVILYFARRYDDSIAKFKNLIERTNGSLGYGWIWLVCDMKGDQPQALEWFILSQAGDRDSQTAERIRKIYRSGGWQAVREYQLESEASDANYSKGKFYRLARISSLVGKKDQAFSNLEKALERRDAQLLMLKQEPAFDTLRSDERFQAILKRIGFDN